MTSAEASKSIVLVEITRDRAHNPRYQTLVSHLANSALRLVSEIHDARIIFADEYDTESLIHEAAQADAVILLGGDDVHPSLYGGAEEYPGMGTHFFRDVDERQAEMVRRLAALGVPQLGICRGAQLVNVAMGGTLVQHLEVPGHRNPTILDDSTLARHEVTVTLDSRLGRALGDLGAQSPDGVRIRVQSSHHQAVDVPGDRMRVVARADDGVVEAIEHEQAPLFAVQWHPEDPHTTGEQVAILLHLLLENDARERTDRD